MAPIPEVPLGCRADYTSPVMDPNDCGAIQLDPVPAVRSLFD